MSDHGEPPQQARPYSPPPPSAPPSPQPSGPYGFPGHPAGGMVDVDPRSAGLERREKPGWALLFVACGAFGMVAALFLPRWAEIRVYGSSPSDLSTSREYPGLFDTLDEVRGTDGMAADPGALASAFFPWLAVGLTAACIVAALVAAVGLRRAALTNAARVVAVVLGLAAVALAVVAVFSLGFEIEGSGEATTSSPTSAAPDAPGPDEGADEQRARVVPGAIGYVGWLLATLTITIAGLIGPRITYLLPAGAAAPQLAGPPGPAGAPVVHGAPFAPGLLRHRTHVGAVVLAGLGALLCLAGYTFLSWASAADTVTFIDIGDSVRDAGGSGNGFAEAYFSFLGWLVLLVAIVVVVLVVLGLKPSVNPRALRPVLVVTAVVLLLVHLGALVDLDLPEYGPAAWVIGFGLGALAVAAMLPLRTTARVAYQPSWPTGS
ncbi:hypothetical protein ABFT23_16260 [Nocardioides sp. C4-1]|uniref:hypothetical protein n=1 Tax=Nocardioides sp. C4-1 TaxID=3151851 RepID=UPI003264E2C4